MGILRNLLVLLAFGLAGSTVAAPRPLLASAWVELGEARLRLLLESPQGEDTEIRAGLEIRLAENFKTYWRNPGDSGVPPQADFSRSSGIRDARLDFPFPSRFDDGAGGIAYGYKSAVILPIVAKRDQNALLSVHIKLDFAVCGTMCIPLAAELELAHANAAPLEAGSLDAARQRVPARLENEAVRARIAIVRLTAGNKPRWRITLAPGFDAASAALFLEANGYLSPGEGVPIADGRLQFDIAGESGPGAGGLFGPTKLTFGDAKSAFEAMIDLDGAQQAP